jgi:hypothetical protein
MGAMRELPVAPICRKVNLLPVTPNQWHFAVLPCPLKGALRDRHECWARDAMDASRRQTNGVDADGEVVWS